MLNIINLFSLQGGRRYYLDFGLLSGFSSVLIGSLGLRARNWQRSPNRNYVTGERIKNIDCMRWDVGHTIIY